MPTVTPIQETELEKLIDDTSLTEVISSLAQICAGKAEHLRVNWQDTHAAKEWDHAFRDLDRLWIRLAKTTHL